ncbi:MAG: hypothetical protein QME75_01645 [Deltaproteobacteria bacterium]|nr:hypothetical protein [Deltaproteobacteria bacterium]
MGIKTPRRNWLGAGFWLVAAVCLGLLIRPCPTQTAEKPEPGSYVILSGEFFNAMQKLAASGATYGDRQEPLLEQIALSGRYMVKTNLTLIHQNEKIIQLLEELNRKRLTMER